MQIEMTDTFGGETNYSWVKRATIDSLPENYTTRQLLRVVREKLDLQGVKLRKVCDTGDFIRWDIQGANVCVMVSWGDL